MRLLLLTPLAFLIPVAPLAAQGASPGPGTHVRKIRAEGHEWTYRLHLPARAAADRPLPLVLVLHGTGSNSKIATEYNGWVSKADREGFAVVAPDGLPKQPGRPASIESNPRVWNS